MSSSRRVAILGATGQLGSDLVRSAKAAGLEAVGLGHEDVEVTRAEDVADLLTTIEPDVLINSAAFHHVDRCEDEPQQAFHVNAVGALLVARAARRAGVRCVYISTDYVFPGTKSPPANGKVTAETAYNETEKVEPLNVYGASKAAGERLTAQALDNSLVVRVSSLFGVAGARGKGGNFIETILKKAAEDVPLRVVNDQWMTPTYTRDAAGAIVKLAVGDVTGTVHVANSGACTWHAFACEAVRAVGLEVPVEAVPATAYPSKARRPQNSALATERLTQVLGTPLPRWEAALEAYLIEKGHMH